MNGRPFSRMSALVVVALCIAFGLGNALTSVLDWGLADVDAYWNAALRLRAGEPLYTTYADVTAAEVYRYAPWLAVAWIPLTFLPRELIDVLWSALLAIASVTVVGAMLSARSRAAMAFAALVGSFLLVGAKFGNIQPLMVAALAFGVERRSGPLWIALAASLKATPLLYVIVYVGRREWRKAAVTIGLTAVLVLPMVAMGIADYPTTPGWSHSLYAVSFPLFAVVALASVVGAMWVAWRHPRYAWLAASVAVILTLPRYFQYELTYLFVGALPMLSDRIRRRTAKGRPENAPMPDTHPARA